MKKIFAFIFTIMTAIMLTLTCVATEPTIVVIEEDYGIAPASIIDPDTRTQVSNTRIAPYNAICKMYVYLDCGCSTQAGTGFLISDNCIVTAAHNFVCTKTENGSYVHPYGKVEKINIYFGLYYNENNVSTCYAATLNVVEDSDTEFGYMHYINNSRSSAYDYGYIILDDDQISDLQGITTYFELESLSDTQISNKSIIITGYPSGKILYTGNGMTQTITSTKVYHNVDTSGGQSGSPMYYVDSNGKYKVIGIHTSGVGSTAYNSGRRIDASLKTMYDSIS